MSFTNVPIIFGAFSYFLLSPDILGSYSVLHSRNGVSYFFMEPLFFFIGGWCLEINIWKPNLIQLSIITSSFCQFTELGNICILTCMYIHTHYFFKKPLYLFVSLCVCSHHLILIPWFQFSTTGSFSSSPFLIFTSFSHSEKPVSPHPQYIDLFILITHTHSSPRIAKL